MRRRFFEKKMKERPSILGSSRLESRSHPTQNCRGGSPSFPPFGKGGQGDFKMVQSAAMLVFQTSQTFPTRSGPGLRVILPGFQPDGVASVPLLSRTN